MLRRNGYCLSVNSVVFTENTCKRYAAETVLQNSDFELQTVEDRHYSMRFLKCAFQESLFNKQKNVSLSLSLSLKK